MRGVRAVFFDAGNTLIFPNYPLIRDALFQRGLDVAAERLYQIDCELRDQLNRQAAAGEDTTSHWEHYWPTFLSRAGMTGDVRSEMIKELTMRSDEGKFWIQVPEGTTTVLGTLRRSGIRLGVISNSEGKLEYFLQYVGIREYFDFVLDSTVVGVSKPDPAIFKMALDAAQVEPSEAVYVGDNYAVDVIGARKAGITPVLFMPGSLDGEFDCVTIKRLTELMLLVGR